MAIMTGDTKQACVEHFSMLFKRQFLNSYEHKRMFYWIGYRYGSNWHLRLHNVNKKFSKNVWVGDEDYRLADEELKQSTMLEF